MVECMKREGRYDDIIDLPHPVSAKHASMSLHDRAAQFSPFAALTGHEDAILETGRRTEERVELDEDARETLDRKLGEIIRQMGEGTEVSPEIRLTYFVKDARKAGGSYVTVETGIRRIDSYKKRLFLVDGTEVSLDDVYDIEEI